MQRIYLRSGVVLAAIAALISAPAIAQESVALVPNTLVEWQGEEDGTVFTFEDWRMTLSLIEGDGEWVESAELAVEGPGFAPFKLVAAAGMSGYGEIGLFDIDGEAGPSILFGAYTGGAHCCMDLSLAHMGDGEPVPAHVGVFDSGLITPEDVDGDGRFEIVVADDRFLYTFDAYAVSFAPIVVLTSHAGQIYNVSADPIFRDLIEREFAETAAYCSGDTWYAGACASLLANAARMGTYAETRAAIATHLSLGTMDSGWETFSFCEDPACETEQVFDSFLDATDFALSRWGYLEE